MLIKIFMQCTKVACVFIFSLEFVSFHFFLLLAPPTIQKESRHCVQRFRFGEVPRVFAAFAEGRSELANGAPNLCCKLFVNHLPYYFFLARALLVLLSLKYSFSIKEIVLFPDLSVRSASSSTIFHTSDSR